MIQRNYLKFPENIDKINIDMPSPDFREPFIKLSIPYRLLFILMRPLLWFLSKIPTTKKMMINSLTIKEAAKYQKSYTQMDNLILTERDHHIFDVFRKFSAKRFNTDTKLIVSTVSGAKHMVAVSHCLRDLGYKPKTKKWFDSVKPNICSCGEKMQATRSNGTLAVGA